VIAKRNARTAWVRPAAVILASCLVAATGTPARGQVINDPQIQRATEAAKDAFDLYEAQLKSVLRTRLEAENKFVTEVVEQVRAGEIPKGAVDRAWLWVRSNRPAHPYPFVYFEHILRLEGKSLKFEIPEFDRNIYSQIRKNSDTRRARRRFQDFNRR